MDYITISTTPTCTDFGDLLLAVPLSIGATSNDTNERGIFTGGASYSPSNAIDYITINSTGNATDFIGVLTTNRYNLAGLSNGTNERGCFNGNGSNAIAIDYITINSGSSAGDFGDLTEARSPSGATSNGTSERGVWAGGVGNVSLTYSNVIDFITINSIGNATDFGDLTISMSALAGTSNLTDERGIFGGGYTGSDQSIISYITINSLSSAASFGNLSGLRRSMGACSG